MHMIGEEEEEREFLDDDTKSAISRSRSNPLTGTASVRDLQFKGVIPGDIQKAIVENRLRALLDQQSAGISSFAKLPHSNDITKTQKEFSKNTMKSLTMWDNKKAESHVTTDQIEKPEYYLKSTLREKEDFNQKLEKIKNQLSTSKIPSGVFIEKRGGLRFPQVPHGQQAGPLPTQAIVDAIEASGHIRRQSLPVNAAKRGSNSSLASPNDKLTLLQKHHKQRELDNSQLGSHVSRATMPKTDPRKKSAKNIHLSPPPREKEGDVPRTHLMRIKDSASNQGNATLFFSNETFAFKPEEETAASRLKAKSILDIRQGQRDPGAGSSPMGQNPINHAYSTPKAEIKGLNGVRRFKRESMVSRNAIDAQFSSTIRHQGQASEASRKVYLPDIIRLSKTNLHDLTKLSGQKEKDFLSRFKNSIQLSVQDEDRFEQKLAQGKVPPPKHPSRLAQNVCPYQRTENIT